MFGKAYALPDDLPDGKRERNGLRSLLCVRRLFSFAEDFADNQDVESPPNHDAERRPHSRCDAYELAENPHRPQLRAPKVTNGQVLIPGAYGTYDPKRPRSTV